MLRVSSYVAPQIRQQVWGRDGQVCQYCEGGDKPGQNALLIEHVVPVKQGGFSTLYNLVVACRYCNSQKRGYIWIPRNLDLITADHPEWRERIVSGAVPTGYRPPSKARNVPIPCWVTAATFAEIEQHATQLGLTVSQYVQEAIKAKLAS
jgi:hypothetical protein